MDSVGALTKRVRLVIGADGRTRYLLHPFNGRFCPVDHHELDALVGAIASRIDVSAVDYVIGFPEGGSIPAYAFERIVDRPVILASRLPLDVPGTITFEQPGTIMGKTHHLLGLQAGDRVMIVEDELTNGDTAVNAVRALRRAGVSIDHIATLLAVDRPELWRRMSAEHLALHVGVILPAEYAPRSPNGEPR
jgi:adenine/guanine phosphoribosyltransferase-like PRPP-binding protein